MSAKISSALAATSGNLNIAASISSAFQWNLWCLLFRRHLSFISFEHKVQAVQTIFLGHLLAILAESSAKAGFMQNWWSVLHLKCSGYSRAYRDITNNTSHKSKETRLLANKGFPFLNDIRCHGAVSSYMHSVWNSHFIVRLIPVKHAGSSKIWNLAYTIESPLGRILPLGSPFILSRSI